MLGGWDDNRKHSLKTARSAQIPLLDQMENLDRIYRTCRIRPNLNKRMLRNRVAGPLFGFLGLSRACLGRNLVSPNRLHRGTAGQFVA